MVLQKVRLFFESRKDGLNKIFSWTPEEEMMKEVCLLGTPSSARAMCPTLLASCRIFARPPARHICAPGILP